jgi:hypothetical protein
MDSDKTGMVNPHLNPLPLEGNEQNEDILNGSEEKEPGRVSR